MLQSQECYVWMQILYKGRVHLSKCASWSSLFPFRAEITISWGASSYVEDRSVLWESGSLTQTFTMLVSTFAIQRFAQPSYSLRFRNLGSQQTFMVFDEKKNHNSWTMCLEDWPCESTRFLFWRKRCLSLCRGGSHKQNSDEWVMSVFYQQLEYTKRVCAWGLDNEWMLTCMHISFYFLSYFL